MANSRLLQLLHPFMTLICLSAAFSAEWPITDLKTNGPDDSGNFTISYIVSDPDPVGNATASCATEWSAGTEPGPGIYVRKRWRLIAVVSAR